MTNSISKLIVHFVSVACRTICTVCAPLSRSQLIWKRNNISFALFRYELKLFVRRRHTWIVFALLFAAMLWGAFNGQRHAEEQQATVERIRLREANDIKEHKAAAARYAQPAAARLPYWQDPTDVSGYMRYGLVAFSVKSPSPMAAISVGQSKVLPFYLRAELDYLSPPDAAFDFVNPRILSLGDFDLAFVLVYLLPLALILLGASRLSAERDSGALRLLATHAGSPRRLIVLKFGTMALVCTAVVLLMTGFALAMAGTPVLNAQAWSVLSVVTLAIAGYAVFWIGLIALVASRTGVIASHTLLVSLWAAFTFFAPAAGAFALELLHPAPSHLRYLNELRRESNLTSTQRDAIVTAYLTSNPAYAAGADRLAQIPYATKQIAIQKELDRRLLSSANAIAKTQADAKNAAGVLRWLSPSLALDTVLQTAAGTDAIRQEAFLRRSRAYTDELRTFFWPRALKEAAAPSFPCPGCAGRLNFTDHDSIPRFVVDSPLAGVTERMVGWAVYPWLLAAAMGCVLWRTRSFRF
jgi:ABC-2 type transport system permease protein